MWLVVKWGLSKGTSLGSALGWWRGGSCCLAMCRWSQGELLSFSWKPMKHLIKEQRRIQSPEFLLYWGRFYWKLEDSSYNKLPFEEINRKLNFFTFLYLWYPRLGCSDVCIYYQSSHLNLKYIFRAHCAIVVAFLCILYKSLFISCGQKTVASWSDRTLGLETLKVNSFLMIILCVWSKGQYLSSSSLWF